MSRLNSSHAYTFFLGLYVHWVFAQTLTPYNWQSLGDVNISCSHLLLRCGSRDRYNTTSRFYLVDALNLQLATVAIKRESAPYESTVSSTY